MVTPVDEMLDFYERMQQRIGPGLNQKSIQEYLGDRYFGTPAQDEFIAGSIEIGLNSTTIGSYEKGDGTEVKSHKKMKAVPWNSFEEGKIEELYRTYGKSKATAQIELLHQMLGKRHSRQAIAKKRQRLIRKRGGKHG